MRPPDRRLVRAVVKYTLLERPSTYQNRVSRRWQVTLSCGHVIEQKVFYRPSGNGPVVRARAAEDAVPPRPQVPCTHCLFPVPITRSQA